MTRHHWINVALGAIALVLVAVASYLNTVDEGGDAAAANTTAASSSSAASTTSSTSSTTTSTTSTTSTALAPTTTALRTTLPPTGEPPVVREYLAVVVSKGPGSGGRIQPMVDTLRQAGYGDVRGLNGAVRAGFSTVYFADGLQSSAEQLAADAGLTAADVAPMADAPPVAGRGDVGLLLYLG
ncbi:MAG: hypothetical protein AAFY28_15095 [Actinomycetota bacterium]